MQTTVEPGVRFRPKRRRMTRHEFELAGEKGVYGPEERLELIEGEVFAKLSPQLTPHAVANHLAVEELREAFSSGFHVRNQAPMGLSEYNEPEPDVAVIRGGIRDYLADHPTSAVLVVEISDTTLRFDLKKKAPIYARASVTEYLVVDIQGRAVHVHREPVADSSSSTGFSYSTVTKYSESQAIVPVAAPSHSVQVADLLP
jgi:Uma2 family endonuclease